MAASFAMAASSAIAMPSAITASSATVASSASRDYAKHSIMNASVSFSFWHKFAVVNDRFFGTQKALYKRPGQKRGTCQSAQKSPSARRKIVQNRKFVPELPKSGHVFGKTGTKRKLENKAKAEDAHREQGIGSEGAPSERKAPGSRERAQNRRDAESKSSKTSSARKAKARYGSGS